MDSELKESSTITMSSNNQDNSIKSIVTENALASEHIIAPKTALLASENALTSENGLVLDNQLDIENASTSDNELAIANNSASDNKLSIENTSTPDKELISAHRLFFENAAHDENQYFPNIPRLWMGSINSRMPEPFLENAFKKMGEDPIGVRIVRNRHKSKDFRYCFVYFDSQEIAIKAMHKLNGKPIPDTNPVKKFRLNPTKSYKEKNKKEYSIWVGNLTEDVDDYKLYVPFSVRYKSVKIAKVMTGRTGNSKGYGFIRFSNEEERNKALLEMDNSPDVGSRPIKVRAAKFDEFVTKSETFIIGNNNIILTEVFANPAAAERFFRATNDNSNANTRRHAHAPNRFRTSNDGAGDASTESRPNHSAVIIDYYRGPCYGHCCYQGNSHMHCNKCIAYKASLQRYASNTVYFMKKKHGRNSRAPWQNPTSSGTSNLGNASQNSSPNVSTAAVENNNSVPLQMYSNPQQYPMSAISQPMPQSIAQIPQPNPYLQPPMYNTYVMPTMVPVAGLVGNNMINPISTVQNNMQPMTTYLTGASAQPAENGSSTASTSGQAITQSPRATSTYTRTFSQSYSSSATATTSPTRTTLIENNGMYYNSEYPYQNIQIDSSNMHKYNIKNGSTGQVVPFTNYSGTVAANVQYGSTTGTYNNGIIAAQTAETSPTVAPVPYGAQNISGGYSTPPTFYGGTIIPPSPLVSYGSANNYAGSMPYTNSGAYLQYGSTPTFAGNMAQPVGYFMPGPAGSDNVAPTPYANNAIPQNSTGTYVSNTGQTAGCMIYGPIPADNSGVVSYGVQPTAAIPYGGTSAYAAPPLGYVCPGAPPADNIAMPYVAIPAYGTAGAYSNSAPQPIGYMLPGAPLTTMPYATNGVSPSYGAAASYVGNMAQPMGYMLPGAAPVSNTVAVPYAPTTTNATNSISAENCTTSVYSNDNTTEPVGNKAQAPADSKKSASMSNGALTANSTFTTGVQYNTLQETVNEINKTKTNGSNNDESTQNETGGDTVTEDTAQSYERDKALFQPEVTNETFITVPSNTEEHVTDQSQGKHSVLPGFLTPSKTYKVTRFVLQAEDSDNITTVTIPPEDLKEQQKSLSAAHFFTFVDNEFQPFTVDTAPRPAITADGSTVPNSAQSNIDYVTRTVKPVLMCTTSETPLRHKSMVPIAVVPGNPDILLDPKKSIELIRQMLKLDPTTIKYASIDGNKATFYSETITKTASTKEDGIANSTNPATATSNAMPDNSNLQNHANVNVVKKTSAGTNSNDKNQQTNDKKLRSLLNISQRECGHSSNHHFSKEHFSLRNVKLQTNVGESSNFKKSISIPNPVADLSSQYKAIVPFQRGATYPLNRDMFKDKNVETIVRKILSRPKNKENSFSRTTTMPDGIHSNMTNEQQIAADKATEVSANRVTPTAHVIAESVSAYEKPQNAAGQSGAYKKNKNGAQQLSWRKPTADKNPRRTPGETRTADPKN